MCAKVGAARKEGAGEEEATAGGSVGGWELIGCC